MSHVKLGIVRLGTAAGKIKYTILDEEDIALVEQFVFEPRIEIDRNGNGAKVYAYAYKKEQGRKSACSLHNMLWMKHNGGIAHGYKVIHKNGVTVDNRLENLALSKGDKSFPTTANNTNNTGNTANSRRSSTNNDGVFTDVTSSDSSITTPTPTSNNNFHQSLYYSAICQLPDDLINEQFPDRVCRSYNADGELTTGKKFDEEQTFFECRYPPCTNMETTVGEFGVCGRCRNARYCGNICQQKDWATHKKHCIDISKKRRLSESGLSPER